jgi:hypothetical protein
VVAAIPADTGGFVIIRAAKSAYLPPMLATFSPAATSKEISLPAASRHRLLT